MALVLRRAAQTTRPASFSPSFPARMRVASAADQHPPPMAWRDSFERVTYSLCVAGFLGLSFLQFVVAAVTYTDAGPSHALSNTLGGAVNLIAGLHYRWMRDTPDEVIATRYSDWYITTALMLLEFFNLAGTLVTRWGWLLGACLACELMILCGHVAALQLAHAKDARLAFTGGLVSFAVLIASYVYGTVVDLTHPAPWAHAFAALWLLYPVCFWLGSYQNLAYNLIDFYSKGIFGLVLALVTFVPLL